MISWFLNPLPSLKPSSFVFGDARTQGRKIKKIMEAFAGDSFANMRIKGFEFTFFEYMHRLHFDWSIIYILGDVQNSPGEWDVSILLDIIMVFIYSRLDETRCSWMKKQITDFRFFARFLYIPLNNKYSTTQPPTTHPPVGCWGEHKPRQCKGSVWALWFAGGIWNVLTTTRWLCIVGAFTKFAFLENRIFWERGAANWKKG